MNASLKIRRQVETALGERIPSALSPRIQPQRESCATGIHDIDALLQGGLPVGGLTELVGVQGSGRTTFALSFVSGVTTQGCVCAWIDATDALDPESAAANGVDLERLLWIRCGGIDTAVETNQPPSSRDDSVEVSSISTMPGTHGGSPHPRGESKGMPQAVSLLFQAHSSQTAQPVQRSNKPIGATDDKEEQVASDRLPPRRRDNLPVKTGVGPTWKMRSAELQHNRHLNPGTASSTSTVWKQIDQALRATDLLLQAGGFNTIVLDLGSIPAEYVWKIPLATWFRFRAAAERSRTSVLLLTQYPCSRSSAELVLQMTTGTMTPDGGVLSAMTYHVEVSRKRFEKVPDSVIPIRKPPRSEKTASWLSKTAWARHR